MNSDINKYFDDMFKGIDDNIVLDDNQREAILSKNDKVLIIAGAGTGKTTTMGAKVKYLVDIKHVDPKKILVMSYTKKATNELEELIVDDFNIGAHVTTFHSLGFEYIRKIFPNRNCYVLSYNDKEEIFLKYFKELFKNKSKIKTIIDNFTDYSRSKYLFSDFFIKNYEKYENYDSFFEAYKRKKFSDAYSYGLRKLIDEWVEKRLNFPDLITINGEYVKSAAEFKIANFLFTHGIDYEYEKIYSEIMEDRRTYRPDFTIDYGGKKIYLEYFGLDDDKYNRNKLKKLEYFKNNDLTTFIYLDRVNLDSIEEELDKRLKELNIVYRIKSDEEIYDRILEINKLSNIFQFKNFMYNMVDAIKEYPDRGIINDVFSKAIQEMNDIEREIAVYQKNIILEFYKYYYDECYKPDSYGFDYADLLYFSNKYLNRITDKTYDNFDYIIIDEYQDISESKYLLTKNTLERCNAKLFVVGDDWQSIYSFSGSDIKYIYNIQKYFPDITIYKITNTYRNSQKLIDYAGEFIMRNKMQIQKNLVSEKQLENPIVFKEFSFYDEDNIYDSNNEYLCLKETINEIHKNYPDHNILILARTNYKIDHIFADPDFIDSLDTKIIYKEFEDLDIEGMTIHKSKGLTFDEVIVIGLNNKFPSSKNEPFWMMECLKHKLEPEGISYPEERRLFYVALTRTRNHVYLLKAHEAKYRSCFIDELESIIEKDNLSLF